MASYRKFAYELIAVSAANLLVALSGVALVPILSRGLGTSSYGLWAQSQVTVALLLGVVGLGLPYALSRFIPARRSPQHVRDDFWATLAIVASVTGVATAVMALFPGVFADSFFEGSTETVRLSALVAFFWSLDSVFIALYRATRRMVRYAVLTVADVCAQVVLAIVLLTVGFGLRELFLGVAAFRAGMLLAFLFLAGRELGVSLPRFSRMREYFAFGLPTIPSNFASWIVSSSSRYAIGYFASASAVGVFTAAYTVGGVAIPVGTVLGFVLAPVLSGLYDEGRLEEVRKHLSYSLKLVLVVNAPLVVGAAVFGRLILALFTTSDIAARGSAVVPLVALSTLLLNWYVVASQVLVVAKRTLMLSAVSIAAAIVNLATNLVFIPRLGLVGAGVSALSGYAVSLALCCAVSRRILVFSVDRRFLVKVIVASGVMGACACFLRFQTTLWTLVEVLLSSGVYATALLLLRVFTPQELGFIWSLMRKRRQTSSGPSG